MTTIGILNLSFPGMDLETFARTSADLGLHRMDIHVRLLESADPDYLRHVNRVCLRYGLSIGYMGINAVTFARGRYFEDRKVTLTADDLRGEIANGQQACDIAAYLGIPLIRVFAPHPPKGIDDTDPMYAPLADAYREIAAYGEEVGVIVGLQNHDNRNLAATSADVLRILRQVDHPNFCHILDTGQWAGSPGANRERRADPDVDIYDHIARTAPEAILVRCKFYDLSEGVERYIDYARVFEILQGVGFRGHLSIVYEGPGDPLTAVRQAMAFLRTLTPTLA
jgi:sugar phosphate isomerase/epimerase